MRALLMTHAIKRLPQFSGYRIPDTSSWISSSSGEYCSPSQLSCCLCQLSKSNPLPCALLCCLLSPSPSRCTLPLSASDTPCYCRQPSREKTRKQRARAPACLRNCRRDTKLSPSSYRVILPDVFHPLPLNRID